MTPGEWLDQTTVISREGVRIGEHQVPGLIAEGGVTVHANFDGSDYNLVTVQLLVGRVEIDDTSVMPVNTAGDLTTYGTKR